MNLLCALALIYPCWPSPVEPAPVRIQNLPLEDSLQKMPWREKLMALDQGSAEAREDAVLAWLEAGGLASDLRYFQAIDVREGKDHLRYWVAPDYLALGEGADKVRVALGWPHIKRLVKGLRMLLPSSKMVNQIHEAASLVYWPHPFPPDEKMETFGRTLEHEDFLRDFEGWPMQPHPLRAGHKKDIVVSPRLLSRKGKLAIYGWHNLPNGMAIQPLSTWHAARYVDYSHGIRLVAPLAEWNGQTLALREIFQDPRRAHLLSFEGAFDVCTVLEYDCGEELASGR